MSCKVRRPVQPSAQMCRWPMMPVLGVKPVVDAGLADADGAEVDGEHQAGPVGGDGFGGGELAAQDV